MNRVMREYAYGLFEKTSGNLKQSQMILAENVFLGDRFQKGGTGTLEALGINFCCAHGVGLGSVVVLYCFVFTSYVLCRQNVLKKSERKQGDV